MMRERELVFRIRLPQLGKRWFLATVALIVGSGAIVYATVPNVFNAGDPLSAAKVNANFNGIDTRVTSIENKPAGGKVSPVPSAGYYINDSAMHTIVTVSVNAPGPGVVMAASSGWIEFYTHTNGTQDSMYCCLDSALNCNSSSFAYQWYQTPAQWPTVPGGGANTDVTWPLSMIGTIPVSAAGAVSVNLNCYRASGDGNGVVIQGQRLQAFYMPGQY
jgi:hypothetical protein